jgi:pimeloyl-ACP methyl ester carboxylesterase
VLRGLPAGVRVSLVGHSFGAAQAYQYVMEDRPAHVDRMVLLDPWLFPVSRQHLPERVPIATLVVNSETFFAQEEYSSLRQDNQTLRRGNQGNPHFQAVWIRGTDHQYCCDFAVLLGFMGSLVGIRHEKMCFRWLWKAGPWPERVLPDER